MRATEFINEILYVPGVTKDTAEMQGDQWLGEPIADQTDFKLLFKYAGNQVFQHIDNSDSSIYYVVVNDAGIITAVMNTVKYNDGEQVIGIQSTAANTLKLVDLYHLMILKGKKLVSDYIQSPGGKNVWMKLAQLPGINVKAWDHKQQKYIKTPITDIYVDPNDRKQMASKRDMQHVLLIGSTK